MSSYEERVCSVGLPSLCSQHVSQLLGWLVGWLVVGWLVGQLVTQLFVCLFGWLVGWLFGWLFVCLFGCLFGWLVVCLFVWLFVCLVGWLVRQFVRAFVRSLVTRYLLVHRLLFKATGTLAVLICDTASWCIIRNYRDVASLHATLIIGNSITATCFGCTKHPSSVRMYKKM